MIVVVITPPCSTSVKPVRLANYPPKYTPT